MLGLQCPIRYRLVTADHQRKNINFCFDNKNINSTIALLKNRRIYYVVNWVVTATGADWGRLCYFGLKPWSLRRSVTAACRPSLTNQIVSSTSIGRTHTSLFSMCQLTSVLTSLQIVDYRYSCNTVMWCKHHIRMLQSNHYSGWHQLERPERLENPRHSFNLWPTSLFEMSTKGWL